MCLGKHPVLGFHGPLYEPGDSRERPRSTALEGWRLVPPRVGVTGGLGPQTKHPHRERWLSTRSGPVQEPDTDEGETFLLNPGSLEGPGSL